MEFTLLWAALLAVGALWLMLRLERRLGLLPDDRSDWFDTLLGAAVFGLVAGRIAAMLLTGTNPLTHPADIILIRGGVDTGFASIGALLFLIWAIRRSLPAALDLVSPAVLAGLAGWHGGCVFRGTCLGTRSEVPWAFAEPGSSLTRHPTELYAAFVFAAAALGALFLLRRLTRPGVVAAGALATAGAIRLITEPIRPSLGSGPIWWYSAGLLVGAVLAATAFFRQSPDRRPEA
ncbi:MAG: prolipoprotein diacylglyceryl transferase [Acidimicrobiia bacterium]|nr:prolipoprotein diacylglyceryl transferase [Acidimicrobiia bacterium]